MNTPLSDRRDQSGASESSELPRTHAGGERKGERRKEKEKKKDSREMSNHGRFESPKARSRAKGIKGESPLRIVVIKDTSVLGSFLGGKGAGGAGAHSRPVQQMARPCFRRLTELFPAAHEIRETNSINFSPRGSLPNKVT
jgi:hypothetical protein